MESSKSKLRALNHIFYIFKYFLLFPELFISDIIFKLYLKSVIALGSLAIKILIIII